MITPLTSSASGSIGDRLCFGLSMNAGAEEWLYRCRPEVYDRVMAYREEVGRHIGTNVVRLLGRQPENALDLASGTGRIVAGLREHVRGHITGIDDMPSMLDVARAKNIPDAEFRIGNMNVLGKEADGSAELITLVGGLRFAHSLSRIHAEIARLLTPEGIAAVVYSDISFSQWAKVSNCLLRAGLEQRDSIEMRSPPLFGIGKGRDETTILLQKQA